MNKVAFFTIAVGQDSIYFDSVRRYFPYNKKYFGQNQNVDYLLFTDRNETIEGITNIPLPSSLWPYTALLKNNSIFDYLEKTSQWGEYSHIFFIDADFSIGNQYDFFTPDFILVKPYWNNKNGGGFFYGGKTEYFKKLCILFYEEIQFIYENKLSVPRDLDEFYLGLFKEEYFERIHLIEMNQQTNTLIFYDNENLDEKIQQKGKRLFMQPYKAEGRANKTIITDRCNNQHECIVNLYERYIFNNYTYDFGRLLKIDDITYRIIWSKQPEIREILNIETNEIYKRNTNENYKYSPSSTSLALSIIVSMRNSASKHLQKTLESIFNQTFDNFEVIVILENSMEKQIADVIKGYHDKRIRLLINQHVFIDSLNKGMDESNGKYIIRMDAGDVALPDCLSMQYSFMEQHQEIDVCGSWAETLGNAREILQTPTEHQKIISFMLLHNPMARSTVFLRKSAIYKNAEALYKINYDNVEDYKLWTDLAILGLQFANIPEVLFQYHDSENPEAIPHDVKTQQMNIKIQAEYARQLIEQIVKKKEIFHSFFNSLINLLNKNIISLNQALNIVYQIYLKEYPSNIIT
jgi:glycosyltransferase involved in cell wall biosynthesis